MNITLSVIPRKLTRFHNEGRYNSSPACSILVIWTARAQAAGYDGDNDGDEKNGAKYPTHYGSHTAVNENIKKDT